jgi:hypothetical protein
MKPGDKVFYTKNWSNGYRWRRRFPALITEIRKSTVRILVATFDQQNQMTLTERRVPVKALTPREDTPAEIGQGE